MITCLCKNKINFSNQKSKFFIYLDCNKCPCGIEIFGNGSWNNKIAYHKVSGEFLISYWVEGNIFRGGQLSKIDKNKIALIDIISFKNETLSYKIITSFNEKQIEKFIQIHQLLK